MLSEKLKRKIRAYERGRLTDKQSEKLLRDLNAEIKLIIREECEVIQDTKSAKLNEALVLSSRSTFEELVDVKDICILLENRDAKPEIPALLAKLLV